MQGKFTERKKKSLEFGQLKSLNSHPRNRSKYQEVKKIDFN